MTQGWRECLARLVDGEGLTEEETAAVIQALDAPENRKEARQWLALESNLRALGAGQRGFDLSLSREKLIMNGLLRERSLNASRILAARRARRWLWGALSVAAASALLLGWRLWPPAYPPAQLDGDVTVERAGQRMPGRTTPAAGDRIVVGPGGARLRLGGYCRLALHPRVALVLTGEPGREAVRLAAGRLDALVERGHGEFRVETAIGEIEVIGTEFSTMVDRAPRAGHGSVVTVAVRSGRVRCRLAGDDRTLDRGDSHTFGPLDGGSADGAVSAVTEGRVEIRWGTETLHIEPVSADRAQDMALLVPGDPVTVSWVNDGGRRLVTRVRGRIVGRLTSVDAVANGVQINPANGPARRFRPHYFARRTRR